MRVTLKPWWQVQLSLGWSKQIRPLQYTIPCIKILYSWSKTSKLLRGAWDHRSEMQLTATTTFGHTLTLKNHL